jgi:hypothetical protein
MKLDMNFMPLEATQFLYFIIAYSQYTNNMDAQTSEVEAWHAPLNLGSWSDAW